MYIYILFELFDFRNDIRGSLFHRVHVSLHPLTDYKRNQRSAGSGTLFSSFFFVFADVIDMQHLLVDADLLIGDTAV